MVDVLTHIDIDCPSSQLAGYASDPDRAPDGRYDEKSESKGP